MCGLAIGVVSEREGTQKEEPGCSEGVVEK